MERTFYIKKCNDPLIKAKCPFYHVEDNVCMYERKQLVPNEEKPKWCRVTAVTIVETEEITFI